MIEILKKLASPLVLGILFFSTVVLSFLDYEIPTALWIADGFFVVYSFGWYVVSQRMTFYVLKRVAEAAAVLLVIATLTFLLLRVLPGGPFDQEKALLPEIKANIEAKYHLNEPLWKQYYFYISGLLKGDMGQSYKYVGRNITEILGEALPATFQLGIYALVIAFSIGIPAGLFSASRHNTKSDAATMFIAVSGVALPSFFVAAIAVVVFCHELGWLPVALWEGTEYYILPSLVLGTRPAAAIARLTRASVLDVIRSDYIRTARAKGVGNWSLLYRHVLKNSLIPVLTYSGPLVAGVLSGAFIIEICFAVPGMGKHLVQSVTNRDYPLILGTTLLFSALLVLSNLVVDLLYSYFDPRVKLN